MWSPQTWYEEAKRSAAACAPQVRQRADFTIDLYRPHFPKESDAQILKRLKDYADARLDAAPSFTQYPELRGVRELILAQAKGTQEGAAMTDAQLILWRDSNAYYHRFIATGKLEKPVAKCSAVFFPDSDQGALYGSNLDTGLGEGFGPPNWPMQNEFLVCGGVSSGVFLDEESPEIFPAPVFAIMSRYARNADEAVEILTRYNHFWGPGNLIVADRNRRTAMIEKTACRIATRWSPDGYGFVTAMVQNDPDLKKYVTEKKYASLAPRGLDPNNCDDVAYWALQEKRNIFQQEMLDQARKAPTLEWMRKMLQSRDPVKGFCAGDGEPCRPGVPGTSQLEYTLTTKIILLDKRKSKWWARDNAKAIPSWDNPQPDYAFDNSVPHWS
jgi:hypothetical protein